MERTESADDTGPEQRGLFALLRTLLDSSVDLAQSTARMAASEFRIILRRAIARLGLLLAGLLVAVTGLLLVLVGGSLLLSRLAGMEPWAAFVVVGVVTLACGAAFAVRALRLLDAADLEFASTLAELDADIAMLRSARSSATDRAP